MAKLTGTAHLPTPAQSRKLKSIRLPIQHLKEKDAIMAKLEEERRLNLNRNSALTKVGALKQSDIALGIVRCPKCTLYVPCNHFKDIKEIGFGDLNQTSKIVYIILQAYSLDPNGKH